MAINRDKYARQLPDGTHVCDTLTAASEYGTTPPRARTLYRAYRSAGGPAELTGLGDFTMPLAVLHPEIAGPIDEVIAEARATREAKVAELEAQLEQAKKALAELE